MRPIRAALPAAALATTLALTACSSGPEEPEPGPTADDRSAEPDTDDNDGTDGTDGDDGAEDGTTDPACLVGAWDGMVTDPEGLLEQLGVGGLDPEVEQTGTARVEFDGTRMTSVFEDQRTTLTLQDEQGQTFVSRSVLDGSTVGDYVAEDGVVTVTAVDASGLAIEQVMEMGGTEVPLPTEVVDEYRGAFEADAGFRFTCTDDELRLTPQVEGEDVIAGYQQVLTRLD